MGEDTRIEWADHTFNPWIGCSKVSPGCSNCYAERFGKRFGVEWGPGKPRKRTSAANWRKPLEWERRARLAEEQWNQDDKLQHYERPPAPRVFCASLADWLDPEVPSEWLADLLELIAATPHLTWMLLTKRPELWAWQVDLATAHMNSCNDYSARAMDMAAWWVATEPKAPPNVWVLTSAEDQQRLDARLPHLLRIPARVRGLSCEPLLGPLDLRRVEIAPGVKTNALYDGRYDDGGCGPWPSVDWVICGGESGPRARPLHPDWARGLRDQCQTAQVPFFFKQWGEWAPLSPVTGEARRVVHVESQMRGVSFAPMERVGKKAAGRLLDCWTWGEVPSD